LPIDEELLFRAERADLRQTLASRLTALSTDHVILPLAEVDAKLRPVSSATGARCAFEGEPAERRAHNQGWLTTDILHVSGFKEQAEELWVQIVSDRHREVDTWAAPWAPSVDIAERYRAAFTALVRKEDGGLLGGLGASGSDQGALREGTIAVCEEKSFGLCDPVSASWKDKARELAPCFADDDDIVTRALIQGDGASARCELSGLDALDGREGPREACICRALTASSGLRAKAGRRVVRVHFEAADLAGKARPELRVVEASQNLHSEADYHSIRTEKDGKASYYSLQRLVVDNLDALADPLARCGGRDGGTAMVDIDVREDGGVSASKVVTGLAKPNEAACVEKALRRGAFTCTRDGKAAKLRMAITWQGPVK
jgi:hypothetical protein